MNILELYATLPGVLQTEVILYFDDFQYERECGQHFSRQRQSARATRTKFETLFPPSFVLNGLCNVDQFLWIYYSGVDSGHREGRFCYPAAGEFHSKDCDFVRCPMGNKDGCSFDWPFLFELRAVLQRVMAVLLLHELSGIIAHQRDSIQFQKYLNHFQNPIIRHFLSPSYVEAIRTWQKKETNKFSESYQTLLTILDGIAL